MAASPRLQAEVRDLSNALENDVAPAPYFVEQNKPPPALPWGFSRLDLTTLGEYALEIGDGYEIHGTLYPALLGHHITHGRIRLNDEDLEAAFAIAEVGSRVFIY